MPHTLPEAERAAAYPRTPETPPQTLSRTALLLYQALRETVMQTGAARGYCAGTTHVTLHVPVEVVADAIGRHRVTVWRRLPELQAAGLVDARAHKCSSELGRAVNDGTLWAVRLNPDEGASAKLTYEEMKHDRWRDLDRDRRRGRTAHRTLRERREKPMQRSNTPQGSYDLELLLSWSLPPTHSKTPSDSDRCMGERRDLEAVLDVQHADKAERNEAVDNAAQAMAVALRDRASVNWYRWLLWQLLRLEDAGRAAPWYSVYEQARRAQIDAAEGFARKPGALFVSRLKRVSWYEAVMTGPPTRVGVRPVAT